ncbi:hypothetical protein [Kutzneria chonburiensis]|uniref:Uncharacterized protein n=1 Tax=Kutzneria chonburiensis TaxID=1483604 RepID=A0ABV6N0F0_9PSEU|nr:hypothetical protein [Kutzneria chonburiensis]
MIEPDPRFLPDFERLVAEEELDKVAGFRRPIESVDEVPLYSRVSQVAFLDGLAPRARAGQLIAAGAWMLGQIRAELTEMGPGFQCLLVILDGEQLDDDGLVTPAIWYTHREIDLPLVPPSSGLARFAVEVLGRQAKVYDYGMGRVYVDL